MRHSSSTHRRGVALVIVLAFIILIAATVVAFLARSRNTRAIEASGAAKAQAEIFARSSVEYTLSLLSDEISDPQASTPMKAGDETIFYPRTPSRMVPLRQLTAKAAAEFHVPGIYKQSIPAFDPNASNVATDDANRQGRMVPYETWAKSRLYFSNIIPGLIPNWIYFNDRGPTTSPQGEIIGRAAFNMFITNNLLDFSVAGFPSSMQGDIRAINHLKGSTAGANIRKIGFVVPLLNDPDLVLVNYRNRESVRSANYASRILAERDGFLEPFDGDTQFIGRIDMQRFYARLREEASAVFMRDDPLAYMAPLIRSIDGPTWKPQTETAANRFPLTQLRSRDATVTDYFTDGTTRTREITAGEPVAARSFPLNRLAWFDSTSANRLTAIRQYLGLLSGGGKRWTYQDASILTLDAVGALGREPNFFEMLKAAIVSGSLGKSFHSGDGIYSSARDLNSDLQILRIGACIIDAAGADNLPTIIEMNSATVAGVKDLPYLREVRFVQLIHKNAAGNVQRIDQFALPILVNPHATPLVAGIAKPAVRVRMVGDISTATATVGSVTQALLPRFTGIEPEAGKRSFVIDPGAFRTPAPAWRSTMTSVPAEELPDLPPHFPATEQKKLYAFWLAESDPAAPSSTVAPSTSLSAKVELDEFNVVMEYWDGADWVIYDALIADGTGLFSEEIPLGIGVELAPDSTHFGIANAYSLLKPDPRTTRWGPARMLTSTKPFFLDNLNRSQIDSYPGEPIMSYTLPYETNGGVFSSTADPDGIRRSNDLEIGSIGSYVKTVNTVLGDFLNSARPRSGQTPPVSEERNAIRHQPFYTVAELGGVFRDEPWKTLNFATPESGDKALLDFFCINEPGALGISAGRINLNNTNPPDTFDPQLIDTSYLIGGDTAITETEVSLLRSYLVNATGERPFLSPADLVGVPDATAYAEIYPDLTGSKQRREIIARALGTAGQTRTWNFFIDLIAQVGTMAKTPSPDLRNDFIPTAEYRFWIHVAVDRFTGKAKDLHIEAYQE